MVVLEAMAREKIFKELARLPPGGGVVRDRNKLAYQRGTHAMHDVLTSMST